jgi:predicted alpha/beta hydrolase family esterase
MTVQLVFVQGAGGGAYDEDSGLVENLQRNLGTRFAVHYPRMPNEDDPSYETWRQAIAQELASVTEPVMLVGHSLGGSVVIKWLSERQGEQPIAGVFLAASPFWGGAGWRYEGYEKLALSQAVAARLPSAMPIYLYHCRDDAVVPFDHLALYAEALPQATVRAFDTGGHQFNNDVSAIARDIASAGP